MLHATPSHHHFIRRFSVFLVIGIVLGLAAWGARVTRAEFEVPLVDTTDFIQTEFKSIWAYRKATEAVGGGTTEHYEAFAVGKPISSQNGTTSLYKFDGEIWKKLLPQGPSQFTGNYQLNAVAGQYLTDAGYAGIGLVGSQDNRRAYITVLPNLPGNYLSYKDDPKEVGADLLAQYNDQRAPLVADLFNNSDQEYTLTADLKKYETVGSPALPVPDNSELYAIAYAPTFAGTGLAGGMNGWMATRRSSLGRDCIDEYYNARFDCSSTIDPPGNPQPPKWYKERWTLFRPSALAGAGLNVPQVTDNITGIKFANIQTAYVTTSTFPSVSGQPKSPYLRDCANDGTSVSKLFKVVGAARDQASWTRINQTTNECFYDLTVTPIDEETNNNGPLQTNIWIASSKGVKKIIDNNSTFPITADWVTTAPCGTSNPCNRAVYGIASQYDRSGDTQQLLINGDFQSWAKELTAANMPNDAAAAAIDPQGWLMSDTVATTRNAAGACETGSRDHMMIESGAGLPKGWALKIEPGLAANTDCTIPEPSTAASNTRVIFGVQRINLSEIEGTRFRVSGTYSVEGIDSNSWPAGSKPTIRQGGVVTACAGAYPPYNVDCPYANMQELKTVANNQTVGGTFQLEFSRAFNQLKKPIPGTTSGPAVSSAGMILEIRCQGTYGTKVICDNLKVEMINQPPQPARSVVRVVAVGERGLTLTNADAVNNPTSWSIEDTGLLNLAVNPISLQAITNAGGSQFFTAGTGTALLRRTPGNISGYGWLGASQASTIPGGAGLGWLAVNCANFRDAADRTLCQRQSKSFGLSLENNILSGQAWFGKQISKAGTNNDFEGRDLGTCVAPARTSASADPYVMTGSCNTTTRTCFANASKACLKDFDCYGRCSGDQAFICLSDADCRATSYAVAPSVANSQLQYAPADNLLCGQTASSPNSCTGLGWLTFNAGDLPGANTDPRGGTLGVTYNQNTAKLDGFARFMTLADPDETNYQPDRGWVSFRGDSNFTNSAVIFGAQSCGQVSSVSVCSDNYDDLCTVSCTAPCVSRPFATCKFGLDATLQSCRPAEKSCTNFCGGDRTKPCTSDNDCNTLWNVATACKPIGYCSNRLSNAVTDVNETTCANDNECGAGSYCVIGSICRADTSGQSCNTYGVDHDASSGKFQGFAWSPDVGWIDFRGLQKGTTRFLQTRLGDIYSGGNIGSSTTTASSTCNATYLISAVGTINNFCTNLATTGLADFDAVQDTVPVIPISSATNDYTNALGRFDLTGLETVARDDGLGKFYNKYDMEVVTIVPDASGSLTHGNPGSLGDSNGVLGLGKKVYKVITGTCPPTGCTITKALKIANGATSADSGAGLLIVEGDLVITNNMQYVSTVVSDLRQLASLVVVVKKPGSPSAAKLQIENQVTNIVGTYYVDGEVFTSKEGTETSSDNRYPLTVRGLMIARDFTFSRKFAGTIEQPLPSELFIFDGRLQSNPLPGMIDFASALPSTVNSSP